VRKRIEHRAKAISERWDSVLTCNTTLSLSLNRTIGVVPSKFEYLSGLFGQIFIPSEWKGVLCTENKFTWATWGRIFILDNHLAYLVSLVYFVCLVDQAARKGEC
jgi:hypothetical protein